MPLVDNAHYVDSVGYAAVGSWVINTAKVVGNFIRATAPAAGNERIFVCIVAGTTHLTTQPTWVNTRGAKTTDNTVTWQECTGLSGVNGDLTNTPSWTISATPPGGVKNTAVVLGQIIKRDNGASYQICTTAGTAGNGSEPAFSDTAGTTTTDNTVTWTSLGAVGNFTGNQAPHFKLQNAGTSTWAQAGNTIFVKSSHAVSVTGVVGGVTITSTMVNPTRVLCHDGGAYPPLAANLTTGASETSTTNDVQTQGAGLYMEGVSLTSAGGSVNVRIGTNNARHRYKNCTFVRSAGSGNFILGINSSGNAAIVDLENCTFTFSSSSNSFSPQGGTIIMRGGSIGGSSLPTTLMTGAGAPCHLTAVLDGVDLSAFASGKTLFGSLTAGCGVIRLVNCKLGASVTVSAALSAPSYRIEVVNCDSGALNYRNEIYDYFATMTTETTIVRAGGFSDGATPVSWKIVTTANNTKFEYPFETFPLSIWNDVTGSPRTATIQGIWGGGSPPNNDEIWVEVEYLGSSSFPVSSFISDAKATILTTPAAQDAGTGVWGGSTTPFALAVTFTPNMKGPVIARVKTAKVSSTFYIDPLITLT